MKITELSNENGVRKNTIVLSDDDVRQAVGEFIGTHLASGLTVTPGEMVKTDEGWSLEATGEPGAVGSISSDGVYHEDRLRATPTPTAAGEIPTASDVQRMSNDIPARL